MGLYDTIVVECPLCSRRLSYQTKAGECSLEEYDFTRVPIAIAISVEGERIFCQACNVGFTMIFPSVSNTIEGRLIIGKRGK